MNYEQILRRSWEMVKKEKIFWVFGVILSTFTYGYNFNSSNYSNISEFFKNREKLPETGEKLSQVLGAATRNPTEFFSSVISSIPATFWLALGLGLLVFIIFNLILGIFIRNWSTGALFGLANVAQKNSNLSLKYGSDYGRKTWINLFLSGLVISIMIFIPLLIGLIIFILPLVLINNIILQIIFGFILFIFVLLFCIISIFSTIWQIFAKITICTENLNFSESLKFSFKLSKKFFFDGLLMGIINQGVGCLSGCVFGCVNIFILATLGSVTFLSFKISKIFGSIFLIFAVGLGLIIILVNIVIQGIVKAVTTTNWILFYEELRKRNNFLK